ncbi:2-oxoglutarate-dependent dioxygenase DAO-like [Bidens hawaiensis]|uniref:2-oxoglutarate-dependent dioxygenase DAO-like n=1 Tax=Bidens hawaiensis TaxID=980011 RepID=UPI00404AC815
MANIPVIDLHDFPYQTSKLIIATACEEWGCFRLLNHHEILPVALMSEMKAVVRSLFELPMEMKRRNVHAIQGIGYAAPRITNPVHESFGFYDMDTRLAVDDFCSQLDATPHQRDTIIRYVEAVHELFVVIVKKLAEGLGVKTENTGIENWPCMFKLNKYNFTPESVGLPGIPTHTDSAFLTILQDDEGVCGLEVMNKSGEFIPVDPWPETLIVNIGDMATIWSNGRFYNVKHRVQCKETKLRVSIASFLLGPKGAVEPLPEDVDDEHPRKYVPITYEDYRKLKFSTNLHAGEALELLYTPSLDKIDLDMNRG